MSSSIREMAHARPASNFLERRVQHLQERQKGSYYGLGITVQSIDGNITVVSPFEGTPAARLGIRAGDVISKIEAEDARGMAIDDAVKRLRGPKGTPVHITIVRQGYDTPLEFTVLRDEIPLHSVPYFFMASKKTGYIRLTDFNETTACRPGDPADCEKELEMALRVLTQQGATSMILDIRDNPGGLLDQAFAVSNLFLKKGQMVVFTRGRTKRDETSYVTEEESKFAAVPLIVLTSKHSASASEIVAGAIQDHDRGLIVGRRRSARAWCRRSCRCATCAATPWPSPPRATTRSGRSIQRDYGSTAFEDYVAPKDPRRATRRAAARAKLTDAGRKVFGGDGITPDFCVEQETPNKFVAYLISKAAFGGFARSFSAAETTGSAADIAGAGKRSEVSAAKLRIVGRDFQVDDRTLADFKSYLDTRKLKYTPEELTANREAIAHQITEQVLLQVFGEGEARRRSMAWDPRQARWTSSQVGPAPEGPQGFIAERVAENRRVAAPPRSVERELQPGLSSMGGTHTAVGVRPRRKPPSNPPLRVAAFALISSSGPRVRSLSWAS